MLYTCNCKKCGKHIRAKPLEILTSGPWQTSPTIINRTIYIVCPDCKYENPVLETYKLMNSEAVMEGE